MMMNRMNRRVLALQVLTLVFLATTVVIAWDDVLASPPAEQAGELILPDEAVVILGIDDSGAIVSVDEAACGEPTDDPFCLAWADADLATADVEVRH